MKNHEVVVAAASSGLSGAVRLGNKKPTEAFIAWCLRRGSALSATSAFLIPTSLQVKSPLGFKTLDPEAQTWDEPPAIPLSFSSSISSFALPNHLAFDLAGLAVPWGQVPVGKGNRAESGPPADKGGGENRTGLRTAGDENRRLKGWTRKKKKKREREYCGFRRDWKRLVARWKNLTLKKRWRKRIWGPEWILP